MPDPSFGPWRVLAQRLQGRRYAGPFPVPEGMQCWVLRGAGDDTALVVWNEHASGTPDLSILLAGGAVEVIDAFGNRQTIPVRDGAHTVPVGRVPIFIENVDWRLAAFRASFAIEPRFIPARYQAHELKLHLKNPWNVKTSGTLRLIVPDEWQVTPRVHRFAIDPGESVELPTRLAFDRNALAGPAPLEALVEMTADRDYLIRLQTDLDIGLADIELAARWQIGGRADLIIVQSITNTGNEPINLVAYVSAPGLSNQRRILPTLQGGQTAVRAFRLVDGASLLPGRRIQLGVTERDGTARLNRVLEIPALPVAQAE